MSAKQHDRHKTHPRAPALRSIQYIHAINMTSRCVCSILHSPPALRLSPSSRQPQPHSALMHKPHSPTHVPLLRSSSAPPACPSSHVPTHTFPPRKYPGYAAAITPNLQYAPFIPAVPARPHSTAPGKGYFPTIIRLVPSPSRMENTRARAHTHTHTNTHTHTLIDIPDCPAQPLIRKGWQRQGSSGVCRPSLSRRGPRCKPPVCVCVCVCVFSEG